MPETAAPAVDFSADADLISFLKAIPDGRYRRGVRYPQWYLLLVKCSGSSVTAGAHAIWRPSPSGTERR